MDNKTKRILMCVLGVLTCGFSIGLFKMAAFGVDPFQTVMSGLEVLLPISFGTLYVIVNVLLLLFSLFADRHYIGLATFINLFLLGYVVDFSLSLLHQWFPVVTITGRVIFLILGILIICFASAMYFVADLGVSTYDAVSLIIANTWHIGQFKYCRIISDLICVVLGSALWLAAGESLAKLPEVVGIGTIITAFFMGPLIEFFKIHVAEPFLNGSSKVK